MFNSYIAIYIHIYIAIIVMDNIRSFLVFQFFNIVSTTCEGNNKQLKDRVMLEVVTLMIKVKNFKYILILFPYLTAAII